MIKKSKIGHERKIGKGIFDCVYCKVVFTGLYVLHPQTSIGQCNFRTASLAANRFLESKW